MTALLRHFDGGADGGLTRRLGLEIGQRLLRHAAGQGLKLRQLWAVGIGECRLIGQEHVEEQTDDAGRAEAGKRRTGMAIAVAPLAEAAGYCVRRSADEEDSLRHQRLTALG